MRIKNILKDKYLDILFVFAISFIYVWNLAGVNKIVTGDEFVYWGIGATIAGFDWKDLLSVSDYYSFGYSFILVPLFLLVKAGMSMTMVIKIAALLNGIFLIGCYFIALMLTNLIFDQESITTKKIISLFATLYIGNLIHMNMVWAETWLIFIYWLVILLLMNFFRTPSCKNVFFLLLSTAYIFTVHMRSVGVVIAVGCVLFLYFAINFKTLQKKVMIFALIDAVFLYVAVSLLKKWITELAFAESEHIVSSINNISANVQVMESNFSVSWLIDVVMSMLGKLFYAGTATFLLAFVGAAFSISCLGKKAIRCIKEKEEWQMKEWLILFCLLSFLAENGVAAIFKITSYFSEVVVLAQYDTVVLGRYADFVVGPIIIIGLYTICNMSKCVKEIICAILFYVCCSGATQFYFDVICFNHGVDAATFRTLQSVWMNITYNDNINNFAYYVAVISLSVFAMLCLCRIVKYKQKSMLCIGLTIICITWVTLGVNTAKDYMDSKSEKEKYVRTVCNIIETTSEEVPIYLVYDKGREGDSNTRILQWMLGKRPIQMYSINEYEKIDSEDGIILCNANEPQLMAMLSDKLEYIYNSGTICIYISSSGKYYSEILDIAEKMQKIPNAEIASLNLADLTTDYSYVKMNGDMYYNYRGTDGAYMTGDMGVELSDGIYEFEIDTRIRECDKGSDIGYITIGNTKGEIQNTYVLKADEFIEKERQTIRVPVEIKDYETPFIGLYTYGQASIRIYNISYQKICNNIELNSEEMAELVDGSANNSSYCYVDSDGSGETGFPYHDNYEWSYLTGEMFRRKEVLDKDYYIVEKDEEELQNLFISDMEMVRETTNYILLRNK